MFVGLDAGEGTRRALASAVTANYFDVFERPHGSWAPVHNGGRAARGQYPCRDHQSFTLGAARRRSGRPRAACAGQRRGVHSGRRGSEGIHGDEHPRTGGMAAAWRARGVHHGRAHRRARGARVGRHWAAPSWHLGEGCRAGTRHRWPPARAGISGDQRRLHARNGRALASHVLPGARRGFVGCEARPAPDGHACDRPDRRVPQPRRSAVGSRAGPTAGIGHQVVTRRRPRAPDAPAAHRRTCSWRWPEARSDCCCRRGRPAPWWRQCILCSPSL